MRRSSIALISTAAMLGLVATAGFYREALSQASGGGVARWFDGFGNPIGSTGSGNATAINFNCTNCGGGGGGGGPFPQTVSGVVTQGGIPWFNSTTQMSTTALLANQGIVVGGGTGSPPSTITPGLNVIATLEAAVNATGGIISPTTVRAGDVAVYNGTAWAIFAGNNSLSPGYFTESASGVPTWASAAASGVASFSATCPAFGPSTGAVTLNNGLNSVSLTGSAYSVVTADCGKSFDVRTGSAFAITSPTLAAGFIYGVTNGNAAGSGIAVTVSGGNFGSATGPTTIAIQPQSFALIWAGPAAAFWSVQTTPSGQQVMAVNSVYSPSASDVGKWIEASGSSTTITLLAAIPANYYLTIQNVNPWGGANITVNPGGSNKLNGASVLQLTPGSSIGIAAGSGLTPTNWDITSGVGNDILIFTNSTTSQVVSSYAPNSSLTWATVACKGSGGGAGSGGVNFSPGSVAATAGAGGGEGASKIITLSGQALGHSSLSVTLGAVGAGGAAVSAAVATNGNPGTAGGTTSLQSALACAPGGGGAGGESTGVLSGGGGGAGASPTGNGGNGSNTAGGNGGSGGGTGGSTGAGFASNATSWCAGSGGNGGTATPTVAGLGSTAGMCGASGAAGGGVSAAGTPQNGGAGGVPFGGPIQTGAGAAGVAAGATGGNGGNATNTGLFADGTAAYIGDGILGGAAGGGGAGAENAAGAATAGSGGTGGIGSGGAGGGAASCSSGTCVSGAGSNGGASVVEIFETNQTTGLNH